MTSPVRAPCCCDDNLNEKFFRPTRLKKFEETTNRRRVIAGEAHWTKVLQVNVDINSSRHIRCRGCSRSPSPSPRQGVFTRHLTPSPRHLTPSTSYPSPRTSPLVGQRKRSKSLGRTGDGLFHNLTNKFRNWIHSKRKYEISPTDWLPGEDRYVWDKDQVFNEDIALRSYRSSFHGQSVPRREDKPVHDVHHSKNEDNTQRTVVQITYSGPKVDADSDNTDVQVSTPHLLKPPDISGRQLLRASRYKHREKQLLSVPTGRQLLTGTISCPPKRADTIEGGSPAFRRRCSTWPVQGKRANLDDSFTEDLDFSVLRDSVFGSSVLDGKKSIEDFSIQYEDLSVIDTVRVGRTRTVIRGRWHGNVTIHLFGDMKDSDCSAFWSDLTKLCRIRHENINLFMGACTKPPNRAVVTSAPAGLSLYENLHTKKDKLNLLSKVQILRQITIGMGYLHAKDIVLRKLNTKNVFLTPKVKISAMDFGFAESKYDRGTYSSIPQGHLTYVAPELLCTMVTVPPRLVTSSSYTNETDVFAFGTLLYEVLAEHFPYNDVPVESLIWQVCKGRRQDLVSLKCTAGLKDLIEDCWAHEPVYRPDFPELSKELLKNSPMYKRHSSSEPERLHRTNSFINRLSPF